MKKTTDVINFLRRDKKRLAALIAVLVGVVLILFSFSGVNDSSDSDDTLEEYKKELEHELTELCSDIDGVGKCKIYVSFAEGEKTEYKGSNVIVRIPPKVQGVTVICEGGDSIRVKQELSECITALFDIGANRICVLKME